MKKPPAKPAAPSDITPSASADATPWPPAGLEGLPAHEDECWGADLSDGTPPRRLVRVADLVRLVQKRHGPKAVVKRCATEVLNKLKGPQDAPTTNAPALFVLQRGDHARPVTDDVWCPRCPPSDAARYARGVHVEERSFWDVPGEEEMRRWLPELCGQSGAIDWLRWCWTVHAERFADLDLGPQAALAISADDAVRLFGESVRVAAAGLAVVPGESDHRYKRKKLPDDETLLREVEALKGQGLRKTTATVAEQYGVSVDVIQAACRRAKDREKASAVASKPAWPYCQMGKRRGRGTTAA